MIFGLSKAHTSVIVSHGCLAKSLQRRLSYRVMKRIRFQSLFLIALGCIPIINPSFAQDVRPVEELHTNRAIKSRYSQIRAGNDYLRHGPYIEWYDNGRKLQECSYDKGKLAGPYRSWYENGMKLQEFSYVDGKKAGRYVEWHRNGKKAAECTYANDSLEGQFTSWHKNGARHVVAMYAKGIRAGKYEAWYENGLKQQECAYKDGAIDGLNILWNPSGLKIEERIYRNGTATTTPVSTPKP